MSSEPVNEIFEVWYDGICYEVLISGNWVIDPNYGADADGNRGIRIEGIEDLFIENIKPLLAEEDREEIEKLALEQANAFDWGVK